jgi:hypothetical protein
MINWKEEQSELNLCGYCIDYTCGCDGSCFTGNHNINKEEAESNKLIHLSREINKTEKRLKDLLEEHDKIKK